jgi:hypothetical protein
MCRVPFTRDHSCHQEPEAIQGWQDKGGVVRHQDHRTLGFAQCKSIRPLIKPEMHEEDGPPKLTELCLLLYQHGATHAPVLCSAGHAFMQAFELASHPRQAACACFAAVCRYILPLVLVVLHSVVAMLFLV